MTKDFYDLLGVDDDASKEEIRDAFRDMVQEYHPDRNDDPRATAQFTAIKKAYDTLKNPSERQSYDRLGHATYVSKRLDGLPDPNAWPSDDEDEADATDSSSGSTSTSASGSSGAGSTSTSSASTGSTSSSSASTGSTSTGSTSASTSSGTAGSESSSGTGRSSGSRTTGRTSSSGRSSRSTGSTTGSSSRSANSGTGTESASASASTSSAASATGASSSRAGSTVGDGGTARAAAGAASAGAAGSTGQATGSTADDSASLTDNAVVNWFQRALYGWPSIYVSIALYLSGLAYYGYANRSGLAALADALRAAGADAAALRAAFEGERYGVATATEYVATTAPSDPAAAASWLFAAGAVLMPAVFFLVIRTTRQYAGWKPTYLYVVGVAAPAVGLGATVALGTVPLAAELLAYGVVPCLAIAALLARGRVWPRVQAFRN